MLDWVCEKKLRSTPPFNSCKSRKETGKSIVSKGLWEVFDTILAPSHCDSKRARTIDAKGEYSNSIGKS